AGSFMQLLVTVLIARLLGVEAAGIYFFWTALMLETGQSAAFGLDKLAVRELPRVESKGKAAITAFLAPLRSTGLMIAWIGALGLFVYSELSGSKVMDGVGWWLILTASVSGVTLSMINSEAMTGLGKPVMAVIYRHTLPTTILLLSVLVCWTRLTPEAAVMSYSLAFAVAGFGALIGPGFRGLGVPLKIPTVTEIKGNMKEGFPIFLNTVFGSASFLVPLLILERTHSSEEISLLTTGMRIFVLFGVLGNAIYSLQMPGLSRAAHKNDRTELFRLYRLSMFRALMILGLPCIGVLVMAPLVMSMFGEGFERGADGLRVFMVFAMMILMIGPSVQLILMVGKMKEMAFVGIAHCLVASVAAVFVVPRFGALGFACVMGACVILEHLVYLILSCYDVKRGIDPDAAEE
ncbi:MAG: lipopolysaccharide biosynthesis protein, partial [Verrucomicrobiales bacterium]|nr:lipopolysaccharide biosynthesis protein [Verrucomicrobiales bacterium]